MENHNNAELLTEQQDESLETCTKRLSKQLSEYELTCIKTEGKANQLRKERDAGRKQNEKLRKEVDELTNQLLCKKMKVCCLEKEVKVLQEEKEDEKPEDGECLDDSNTANNFQDQNASTNTLKIKDQQDAQNRLTFKLQELKSAIEDNMDRHGKNKKSEEQFIALSILTQSLQNYMDVELESKVDNQEKSREDLVDCSPMENKNSVATNRRSKQDISMWFKMIIYLGPVILSLLCFIAFTAKK